MKMYFCVNHFEWDGGVIAVGGYDGTARLSSVEKYNPVENKWSEFTPLPTTLYWMQTLVWDNDLYVFAGRDIAGVYNQKVYKLKKDEDTWEVLGVTLENIEDFHGSAPSGYPKIKMAGP